VNLVFFKLVRSKTKFWQMVGRGTRLAPSLFAPDEDKRFFYIFDYCQNLEFFSQELPPAEGRATDSLGVRLFRARLDLIGELDERSPSGGRSRSREEPLPYPEGATEADVRRMIAERLHHEVESMNVDNFVVRPHRRLVEKYAKPAAWAELPPSARTELADAVAPLPSQLDPESEDAKRFDLLMLNLQLAVLRSEPRFDSLRQRVVEIAGMLEEKSAIPMVRAQMPLILDLQTDEWWQDVTVPMLESARRRVRDLVQLIEKARRKPLYTDFEDEMGAETAVSLPGFGNGTDHTKFRAKARMFLRAHQDHVAIHKLRMNTPLTTTDLQELERMLVESGVGGEDDIRRAADESNGLGLFVRSLVGLDRTAAKQALTGFVGERPLGGNQIEFVNLVVDHLTEHGIMEATRLYESPFTDLTPHGPDALFSAVQVDALIRSLDAIRASAVAA
jgi:type I restriction enzyme, R subunit